MKNKQSVTNRAGSGSQVSRREFLGKSAAAVAAFTIVPRSVLGGQGQTPPSEKLNIAGVGIGGQGNADLEEFKDENIVALCDVDWDYAGPVFEKYPQARRYRDFRVMLDKEKDIDAVVVATPDHNHAVVAMAAIKAGKHVYCEKPLAHNIEEVHLLTEAARQAGVATQMGNQGQASEATRRIQEIISDGAIGQVREVHVWIDRPLSGKFDWFWPQGIDRPKDTPPVPESLDWDLWLGPAPQRPYHPAYHPFKWRGWWDFGTGALGDMGCHLLDPVFRALKLGYPSTVQACCTKVNKETYPVGSIVTYEFPARGELPPVTLRWYDGGLKPPRPEELEDGRQLGDGGTLYVGEKGKILDGRIIPESKMARYQPPPKTLPRSPGHYREWVNACKGGAPGGSNFNFAGPLTEVVLMGNLALRVELREQMARHKLQWDAQKRQFTNVPEANEFLSRQYRQGWSL